MKKAMITIFLAIGSGLCAMEFLDNRKELFLNYCLAGDVGAARVAFHPGCSRQHGRYVMSDVMQKFINHVDQGEGDEALRLLKVVAAAVPERKYWRAD